MFEAVPAIHSTKEKSDQEQLTPAVELSEAELNELRKEIAETYRVPYEGSHFKKLKRVVGAFVLAGMAVLANPSEGIAPEVSEERLAIQELNLHDEYERDNFRRIVAALKEKGEAVEYHVLPGESLTPEERLALEQKRKNEQELFGKMVTSFREKGGIIESPQLPDQIYKPRRLAEDVRTLAMQSKRPYFLKPEIVLGKDFVQKNPEKAREYMEKIKKTIEATVLLRSEKGQGSGVIVNSEQGKIIVTNAHVAGDSKRINIEYPNGEIALAEVVAKSAGKDLAILKIINWEDDKKLDYGDPRTMKQGIDLAPNKDLDKVHSVAMIGNPFGYPFEAAVGQVDGIRKSPRVNRKKTGNAGEENEGSEATLILSLPDSRFKTLEQYYIRGFSDDDWSESSYAKGETKPGMSGGPIISLNEKGEPRLIGVNQISLTLTKAGSVVAGIQTLEPDAILGKKSVRGNGGVSVKDIREFMVKNGFNPDRSSTQIRSTNTN